MAVTQTDSDMLTTWACLWLRNGTTVRGRSIITGQQVSKHCRPRRCELQRLTSNAFVAVCVARTPVTDESLTAVATFIDLVTTRTLLDVQHRWHHASHNQTSDISFSTSRIATTEPEFLLSCATRLPSCPRPCQPAPVLAGIHIYSTKVFVKKSICRQDYSSNYSNKTAYTVQPTRSTIEMSTLVQRSANVPRTPRVTWCYIYCRFEDPRGCGLAVVVNCRLITWLQHISS